MKKLHWTVHEAEAIVKKYFIWKKGQDKDDPEAPSLAATAVMSHTIRDRPAVAANIILEYCRALSCDADADPVMEFVDALEKFASEEAPVNALFQRSKTKSPKKWNPKGGITQGL